MSRSVWFVAGAGAGVYAMTRARRAAESLTVDGLRDRLGAFTIGARMFRDEVVAGRDEKETELRERLRLVPHGLPELTNAGSESRSASTSTTDTKEKSS